MRAAAERPVTGPAAIDDLAAGGGLEIPGREQNPGASPIVGMDSNGAHEPIPGEHDATTLTHRQPGEVGGAFNGADNVLNDLNAAADDQSVREWSREGGGRDGERLIDKQKRESR